jgi:uncharacterized delta-60 repeat protein
MVHETKGSFAPPFAPHRHMLLAALTVAFICSPGLSRLARGADGRLDPTFGNGGKVTTDFANSFDNANAVAIQSDGKIVVVGLMSGSAAIGGSDFAVARYNPDGSLDATFGTGGKVTTDFSNTGDAAYAVAIQSDGKIVVAGGTTLGPNNTSDFGVVRYNADGTLDTSYGTDGLTLTDFSPSSPNVTGMALQDDGKAVVVGSVTLGSAIGFADFAVARYEGPQQ